MNADSETAPKDMVDDEAITNHERFAVLPFQPDTKVSSVVVLCEFFFEIRKMENKKTSARRREFEQTELG